MGLTSAMRAASFAAMRACVARLWTSSASSAVEVSVSMMAAEVSYLFEDVSTCYESSNGQSTHSDIMYRARSEKV